jgi:hypothetical protein
MTVAPWFKIESITIAEVAAHSNDVKYISVSLLLMSPARVSVENL